MKVEYTVLDPTGNITILVTTPVEIPHQPYVASKLMELMPKAEQVGFLSETAGCDIALRMAGGEFCGNASMSAAAYYVSREGLKKHTVALHVSGADGPVKAEIEQLCEGKWRGTVHMPRPQKLEFVDLPGAGSLPVVSFDGISHVIYEVSGDISKGLSLSRDAAEKLAIEWCRFLGADALGIMFLDIAQSSMTPLVYVPAAGTLFWENSCASGTTACGAYAAAKSGGSCGIALRQPGGTLEIKVTDDGEFLLTGTVLFTCSGSTFISI